MLRRTSFNEAMHLYLYSKLVSSLGIGGMASSRDRDNIHQILPVSEPDVLVGDKGLPLCCLFLPRNNLNVVMWYPKGARLVSRQGKDSLWRFPSNSVDSIWIVIVKGISFPLSFSQGVNELTSTWASMNFSQLLIKHPHSTSLQECTH